jgi:hypothetical protein
MVKINSIEGGKGFTITEREPLRVFSLDVDNTHELRVSGEEFTQGPMFCTLTRLGKNTLLANETETIWTVTYTRINPSSGGDWEFKFIVKDPATYLVLCHSADGQDKYAKVKIGNIDPLVAKTDLISPLLAFTDYTFGASSIVAHGTVQIPDNPVSCYLTQIDYSSNRRMSKPVPQPGNTSGLIWSVTYDSSITTINSGNCYLLEATAGYEGTISVSGTAH